MKQKLTLILIIVYLFNKLQINAQTTYTPTAAPDSAISWFCGNENLSPSKVNFLNTQNGTFRSNQALLPTQASFVIPVVVHVLFDAAHANDPAFNLSYQQIQWQITAVNMGLQQFITSSMPRATNTQIQLCLAQLPMGPAWTNSVEPGVMRYQVTSSVLSHTIDVPGQNSLLNATHSSTVNFPFQNYLNIWIINDIVDTTGVAGGGQPQTGIMGYSNFPNTLSVTNLIDGIVIRNNIFGSNLIPNNQNILLPQLDKGSIFTHEVGHYLNMLHTFQGSTGGTCAGSTSTNCATSGDLICDTPPSQLTNIAVCTVTSTCVDNLPAYSGDQNDFVNNFMCYSDDNCLNAFTADQSAVMQGVLNTAWPTGRMDMTTATNLTATGLTGSFGCCPTGVTTAYFTTTYSGCSVVTFSCIVPPCGMNATYDWNFGDGNTLSATTNTATHTYTAPGQYTPTLTVSGGSVTVAWYKVIEVGSYGKSSSKTICNNTTQGVNFHVHTPTASGGYTMTTNVNGVVSVHGFTISSGNQSNHGHPNSTNVECNIPISLSPTVTLPAQIIYTVTLAGANICPVTFIDTFNVTNCCNNLLSNGDFSNGTNGFTRPSGHGLVNNGPPWLLWPYAPSLNYDSPICGVPSTCTSIAIYNSNFPLVSGTSYHFNSQCMGGQPAYLKYQNVLRLMDTLFINPRILDNTGTIIHDFGPIAVMDLTDTTWHHYDFMFNNPSFTGTGQLSILELPRFYSIDAVAALGFGMFGWGYDFSFDEMSIRAIAPTFTAAITPSVSSICSGQSISLTASAASSYTWSTAANTVSISVSPTVTITYSVVATSSLNCTAAAQSTINVSLPPNITVTPNATICPGNSILLTASGANTYTWSTGSTTSTINVSPSVTTIYTVTGTSTVTSCSNTQTTSVTVAPATPTITASSSSVTVCGSGSATLIASGATNFTWTPGPTYTTTASVTPTVATIYTLSGNYGSGCTTVTTTILVNPVISTLCCSAPTSTINGGYPASGTYTTSTAVIDVQGVVTFTGNTSYTGYTFRMAPGTLLQVYPNVTLTLINCRLFGCNELWNGILLMEDNTNFGNLVLTNSAVEDMYNGIVVDYDSYSINSSAPSGKITISGSLLNKNYTSIKLRNSTGMSNGTGSYPFSLQTSTLSSSTSSTSPGSTLKPSSTYTYAYNQITNGSGGSSAVYLNFPRSFIGIDLLNLGHESYVRIGSRNSSTLTNTFDNLDFGINALEAFPQVFNNYFKNINGSIKSTDPGIDPAPPAPGPDEIGIAVLVTQTTTANYNSCTVGDGTVVPTPDTSPFPHGNKFENCNRGVKATNCRDVIILGNAFTTNTTTIPVSTSSGQPPMPAINPNTYYYYTGQNAIWSTALGAIADVSLNFIRNHGIGIYSSHTLNSGTTGIDINYNDIAASSSTGWCKQAIQATQAGGSNVGSGDYNIIGNGIDSVYNGILASGIPSGLDIRDNSVALESMTKALNTNTTTIRNAIKMSSANSGGGWIRGNTVTYHGTVPTTSATANYVTGIYVVSSPSSKVECNSAYHLGRDFVFEGSSGASSWKVNSMQDSYRGLELRSSAVIGPQGASSGSPNLSANTWTTITQETYVFITNPNVTSKLFLAAGGNTEPTLNFGTNAYAVLAGGLVLSTGTSYTCNSGAAQRLANGDNSNTNSNNNQKVASTSDSLTDYTYLATADENEYEVFADEFMFMNKQWVYKLIEQDSINPGGGSTLDNFYNASQNTAIDKLTVAQVAIASNDISVASSANASAPITNMVEAKHQRANELTLKYMNDRNYVFTSGERSDLFTMANECLVKGYYVVQSRNLVDIIANQAFSYDDNCEVEANTRRKAKIETSIPTYTSFNLFPNPNNGNMQLVYDLGNDPTATMKLFDMTGKFIGSYALENTKGILQMNEQSMPNGIYFYHILVGEEIIKTDKIVIIK